MAKRWDPAKTAEPFQKGNLVAVKSGAQSKALIKPIRDGLVPELRVEYESLSDAEVWLLADRLARIELATKFLDEHGMFLNQNAGEVFPVVDRLEKWSSRSENLLRAARQEKAGQTPTIPDWTDTGNEAT